MTTTPKGFTQIAGTDAPNGPSQINAAELFVENLIGESVLSAANLPASGNWVGRQIVVTADGTINQWSGSGWTLIGFVANYPEFHSKPTTSQSLTGGSVQLVTNWGTPDKSIGFSYSGGKITVARAGVYFVNASLGSGTELALYQNDASTGRWSAGSGDNTLAARIRCAAGDTLSVYCFVQSSVTTQPSRSEISVDWLHA
jgi:hypothetical protein